MIVLILGICSCGRQMRGLTTKYAQSDLEFSSTQSIDIDTIFLVLKGIDLSEDMSVVSTRNDEISVFIYSYPDEQVTKVLAPPILVKSLIIDEYTREKDILWTIEKRQLSNRLLILLLERDSDTPVERLDPVIRVYHDSIIKSYFAHDYSSLERYLGDEDLLGVSLVKSGRLLFTKPLNFTGSHKLDRYEYLIKFIRPEQR